MRQTLIIGLAGATLTLSLAACGGSGQSSAEQQAQKVAANKYAIEQIEANFITVPYHMPSPWDARR